MSWDIVEPEVVKVLGEFLTHVPKSVVLLRLGRSGAVLDANPSFKDLFPPDRWEGIPQVQDFLEPMDHWADTPLPTALVTYRVLGGLVPGATIQGIHVPVGEGSVLIGERQFPVAEAAFHQLSTTANELARANRETQKDLRASKRAQAHLEARYKALVESNDQAVAWFDGEGRLVEANPAAKRILGETEAARLEEAIMQATGEDGSAIAPEAHPVRNALRSGSPACGVTLGLHGGWTWILLDAVPSAFPEPANRGRVCVTFADVTERRRAEEALAEREERYRAFFMHGPDGVVVLDPVTKRLLEFNDRACEQLGYTREEFARLTLADIDAMETPRESTERIRNVVAKGHDDFETIQRTKQGALRNIHVTAQCIKAKGAMTYHCVWRDITEQKRTKDLIEKRIIALTQPLEGVAISFEELFHLDEIQRIQDEFAAATGVASIITRPDGTPITRPSHFTRLCSEIIRKNPKGCSACFRSDAELGRPKPDGPIVKRCLSGGLWDAGVSITVGGHHLGNWLIGQVRDEAQTDEQARCHAREIGVDEGRYLEAYHAVPVMAPERFEQIAKALFTLARQLATTAYQNVQQARYITEGKQAEQEKARLQSQLLQSQKMESLGTLAGGVAHDMNNVLGAILALASGHIGSQPVGSPLHEALATICKATERGGQMVKNLLNFARQSPAELRVLDLNAILRDESRLLERTTLAKVRIQLELEAGLRPILGEASALSHVVMNLCVNAVDAMPGGGTLKLRTRNADPGWIELAVEDTGAGMPPEVLEKAMDPFFTTKEVGKGTGLGLSMAYSTVTAHHGQLQIRSEPGQGTCVTLRFPACEPAGSGLEPGEPEELVPPRRALAVLIIDDDELIQRSLQLLLQMLGHTAQVAQSGEEALERLQGGAAPELIILDMNMPGMGGAATLPRVRALLPQVPVMLSTGRTDDAALALAAAWPGVSLLAKPFGLRELRQQIGIMGLG